MKAMNSDPVSTEAITPTPDANQNNAEPTPETSPPPSYVKLAMRNMVRKRGKSLWHFTLTTVALLVVLVGLAYLTR